MVSGAGPFLRLRWRDISNIRISYVAKNGGRATGGVVNLDSIEVCDFVCVEDGAQVFGVGAKDICDVPELTNVGEALRALDDDEKNTFRISEGIAGNPYKETISESGFYRLVLRSRKPVAKDVCAVLGLDNVTNALRALDDDEKSNFTNCNVAKNGGRANVDEDEKLTRGILGSGLYQLVLSSKLPAAKERF